ncbi:hypothetical protein D3H65_23660 [Paraflavitalea soli]|uniref:Uncharacterized protein n=1 Tax=Paraflavitalea soli TaxID=2315862 RepID=A0A3B7MSH3_9BACT|nr:hypothetical protein [Paraflavitalea soli]AXY76807.1 hypothetical protein D3H65_23660 [Paraflavitalea soli]
MAAVKKTTRKAAPKKAASKGVKQAASSASASKATGKVDKKPVKKAAPAATAPVTGGATAKADSVSVRMYAHGFGDCFLLTFLSKEKPVYRMLIDCGMLTGDTDRLRQVIDHIKTDCGGRLDLVVQTHEHKDHISGFNLRDKNKNLLWDAIKVDRVWLAWTENTGSNGDDLAIQLKQKQDKKKKALAKALQLYNSSIQQAEHRTMMNKEYQGSDYYAAQQRYATALQQILGFFDISAEDVAGLAANGAELGLTMKDAMGYFINRSRTNGNPDISFWNPGEQADAKTTGLPGINFYFLGPPKDYDKLRVMEDSEHIEMYLTEMGLSDNFFVALTSEEDEESNEALSPFHKRYRWQGPMKGEQEDPEGVWNLYYNKDHDWRSIENDWLHNAGALALNLDSYTNNTSLVIAIELEDSDKVLLFPADAQIGNWLSWTEAVDDKNPEPRLKWQVMKKGQQKTITAEELLKRTVFYKVGHHASHNATARKHGLELMTSEDLVAMIPVDEAVAKKQGKKGWKMPAEDLYKRLQEKTKSRIIRLDKGSILANGAKDLPEGAKPNKQQLDDFNSCVSESDILITTEEGIKRPLFWEYLVKG